MSTNNTAPWAVVRSYRGLAVFASLPYGKDGDNELWGHTLYKLDGDRKWYLVSKTNGDGLADMFALDDDDDFAAVHGAASAVFPSKRAALAAYETIALLCGYTMTGDKP